MRNTISKINTLSLVIVFLLLLICQSVYAAGIKLRSLNFYDSHNIDVSEILEGVYYCKFQTESGESVIKKLVITK